MAACHTACSLQSPNRPGGAGAAGSHAGGEGEAADVGVASDAAVTPVPALPPVAAPAVALAPYRLRGPLLLLLLLLLLRLAAAGVPGLRGSARRPRHALGCR